MDHLAPIGPVYQAGTLSGNPLATAAGLAALELLDDGAYQLLDERATVLAAGLQAAFDEAGLVARTSALPGLVGLYFGDHRPVDFADAKATDEAVYAAFFHALLQRGVALAPGAYEVAFPGLAHDQAVLDTIVERAGEAAVDVAATAAGVGPPPPG
jgi:glutamate-1-semialdehyde 2,1-aminomutase